MTGDELIVALQALPPESRALEVYKYNGDCECGTFGCKVEVLTEESAHYEKSDTPFVYSKTKGLKLLYI